MYSSECPYRMHCYLGKLLLEIFFWQNVWLKLGKLIKKMIRLKIILGPLLLTTMQNNKDRFISHRNKTKQKKQLEKIYETMFFQDARYQATKDSDSMKGKQIRYALWYPSLLPWEFLSCGEPMWSLVDALSWGEQAERPGKRWLVFIVQNIGEERTARRVNSRDLQRIP